jgi:hypothetical protein
MVQKIKLSVDRYNWQLHPDKCAMAKPDAKIVVWHLGISEQNETSGAAGGVQRNECALSDGYRYRFIRVHALRVGSFTHRLIHSRTRH